MYDENSKYFKKNLLNSPDYQFLKTNIDFLTRKYNLKTEELFKLLKEGNNTIPIDVFVKELSILETIVKYSHENNNLELKEISKITGKTIQNIQTTYNNSKKKYSKRLKGNSQNLIILKLFNTKQPVLETIVKYLKEESRLTLQEIAILLKRKYGTIWTIYARAKNK
jgi:hypothetical protein